MFLCARKEPALRRISLVVQLLLYPRSLTPFYVAFFSLLQDVKSVPGFSLIF